MFKYNRLYPAQRRIRDQVEERLEKHKPTIVKMGMRSGKSTLLTDIGNSWHGPVICIALTLSQAKLALPVKMGIPYGLHYDRKILLDWLTEDTLVLIDEFFFMDIAGKALYKELMQHKAKPFIIAVGSSNNAKTDSKPHIGPYPTWEVNTQFKLSSFKKYYQEDFKQATRDFGKLPDDIAREWMVG